MRTTSIKRIGERSRIERFTLGVYLGSILTDKNEAKNTWPMDVYGKGRFNNLVLDN